MDEKGKNQLEKTPSAGVKPIENVSGFFKELRGEFNKVVWPSPTELRKQTVTVIVTSVLIGAIICGFDFVFQYGHNLMMSVAR